MNKDIDNIDSTDKSVEKALDIMESSSEINVEQLQEMLKDEETLQACRDIMDSCIFHTTKKWNGTTQYRDGARTIQEKTIHDKNAFQLLESKYGNSRHDCRSIWNLLSYQYPDDPYS